ncbi:uncharacterized protein LOC100906924 [Galendromus occidentalis]|uniref:Uncharacterized protein LOC100906924 n=1 Tax=Galendromus occidentalis TaxID=34638 RepID=A0AAJ6VVV9_9ACAR|nr:uncharacterized protein LOC100906924 [Galendromus occidentalis]
MNSSSALLLGLVALAALMVLSEGASVPNYAPPNAFKYHRRASMPSLSVVSPLDVLRESQMSRILADKINANNALLSRYGKRGEPVNLLQVLEELSQAEEA